MFADRRQAFRDDPYRPDYHFVPPGGILHNPNGALYWNGKYHLFYQFWPPDVPTDRTWEEAMHWGHAVSEDLVHWRDLPVALSPEDGPEAGCFSGQALVEDERALLMYFGTEIGNCIAAADDPYLTDFERADANPVIPLDDAPYEVFDPCLWRDGDMYYLLSGWKRNGRTSEFCFASEDLTEWDYRGTLVKDGYFTDPEEDGAVPNFFELDGQHVLLFFSHPRGPQYYVGDYYGGTDFDIRSHGRLNFGPVDHGNLHAPSVLHADDGRRIAFFNVVEGRHDWHENPAEGWAGVVSLPRDLSVVDGDLRLNPVDEITELRTNHRRIGDQPLLANEEWPVPDVGGSSIELRAKIHTNDAEEVGLSVLRSPDGAEQTTISYWDGAESLGIDVSRSSENPEARGCPAEVGPFALADDEPLALRVFVDKSIVEVFANGRQTLTTRVYPDRAESTGLSLFARRGDAYLESLDVWDMGSIWSTDD